MKLTSTTHIVVAVIVTLLLYSCASIGTPEGGPRDYAPPVVVKASPQQGALNVTKNRFEITFDELIQLKDQQTKVVISPTQKETPLIRAQGKKIVVELRDTLLPATTYCIDFADAISDNNEGNALEGFSYAFSTGDSIDTLQVSGIVLRARDLEPMQHVIVGLHSNLDDSAFTSLPLERLSRTNDRGQFTLRNLKPGRYHVFALNDMDGDYRMARSEDVAFLDEIVVPSVGSYESMDTVFTWDHKVDTVVAATHSLYLPNDLLLCMFNEDYHSMYLKNTKRVDRNRLHVLMGASSDTMPTLTILKPQPAREDWCVIERTPSNDSIFYWMQDSVLIKADTITAALRHQYTDSLDRLSWKTDTVQFAVFKTAAQIKAERDQAKKAEKAIAEAQKKKKSRGDDDAPAAPPQPMLTLTPEQKSTMEIGDTIAVKCDAPIASIDPEGIHLEIKRDTLWVPLDNVPALQQANDYYPLRYVLPATVLPDSSYRLTIDSAAVHSIYGLPCPTTVTEFRVKGVEEYANVYFSVNVRDSAFAELLDAGQKVVRTCPVTGGKFGFANIVPGNYYVKLVRDSNGNGVWDTGNYREHRQPEEVYYYPKRLRLRRNWDVDEVWNIYETAIDLQKHDDIKHNKPADDKSKRRRSNDDEDEEDDEFNSNGFGNNAYSGNRYRDYQNNRK